MISKRQAKRILESRRNPGPKKEQFILEPVQPSRRTMAAYAKILNGAISKTRDSVLRLYSTSGNLKTIDQNLDRLFNEMEWWDDLSVSMKEMIGDLDQEHVRKFYKTLSDRVGISVAGFVSENQLGKVIENIVNENIGKANIIGEGIEARVKEVIRRSVSGQEGKSGSLREQLTTIFKGDRKKAKTIARDQTQRAVNSLNRARQQAVGIKKYKWITSLDNRVRHGKLTGSKQSSNHKVLHGAIINWETGRIIEAPRDQSIVGKTVNNIANGHVGQDYNCRCTARPILEV